jgi:hypothetical protein
VIIARTSIGATVAACSQENQPEPMIDPSEAQIGPMKPTSRRKPLCSTDPVGTRSATAMSALPPNHGPRQADTSGLLLRPERAAP